MTYFLNRVASGEEIGLNIINSESTAEKVINPIKAPAGKWHKAATSVITSSNQRPIAVQESRGFTKVKNKYKEIVKQSGGTSSKWPSLQNFDSCLDITSEDKDLRLLEIIKKMDSIILAAKQSSQG